jgi:quinol monooxygenase YgiN
VSILVLLDLEAQPENVEKVKERLEVILVDTRAFEGCEDVIVHQDQDDPRHFVLEERWVDREKSDAYSAWRAGRFELDGLRPLMARAVKTHYNALDI